MARRLAEAQRNNSTAPAALPVLLTAATGLQSDAATLNFTLTLAAPAYANTVQVHAAPPLLAGQYPAGQDAVIIAILPQLQTAGADLAPAYAAKFGPLALGQQVALTLVPISDQGFKGTPLNITADVQIAPGAAQRTDTIPALKAA